MFCCLVLPKGRVAQVKQPPLRQLPALIKRPEPIPLFYFPFLQDCSRPYRKKVHHPPPTAGVYLLPALLYSCGSSLFVSTPRRAGPCGVHCWVLPFSNLHVWKPRLAFPPILRPK